MVSNPVAINGVVPGLAVRADMLPARSETGIGALMPWAGKLWLVTYPSHKKGTGAGTGLFEIDDSLTMRKRPESIVGTYANRLVHHQSNQLVIGPHIIDVQGNVRNLPVFDDHRLAATMLHLTDPANMVYFLTMEGLLFEANVHTLEVAQLFDLRAELDIHPQARLHFKGGHTAQGRVVVANNSYYEDDFAPAHVARRAAPQEWKAYDADTAGIPPAGRLAEWDGKRWTILERKPFNEVAGRTNWGEVMFATGWDRASAILKVLVRGEWQTYRLPKASHTWEHCWQTEWPRIREIESERYLMDASGMFYELSPVIWDGRLWGVRPIATHLRIIPDYCSWLGFLVLGGNQNTPIGDTNPVVGEAQANLWLGKSDDLWSFGKPKGWGGPWWETPVQAGETSDPFLMTGFEHKVLHLYHDAHQTVPFIVEVDFLGNGTWKQYARIAVGAGGYEHHEFPGGFSAHWVRVRAEKACSATAYFMYT